MQIRNFTLAELTHSQVAIDNKIFNLPSFEAVENLRLLVENVLEPLRLLLKKPINISSGFRNAQVNNLVGGVLNSDHLLGFAADVWISGVLPQVLFDFVRASWLQYTQAIYEIDKRVTPNRQWLHLSYDPKNLKRENLIANINKDGTIYTEI